MGQYVMVARTRASALFYPGTSYEMNYKPVEGEPFHLTFGTEVPVPKNFWVEARGPARNLNEAVEQFGNTSLLFATMIALTANADMGQLEPELVFDVTPGTSEHDFLQSFVPDPPIDAVPGRPIDVELVSAVVAALAGHEDQQRLCRAAVQYVEALRSWGPGREITCIAHLYMGVEAVTKAVLRAHVRRSERSLDELVADWNLRISARANVGKEVEHEARRRLIFHGDLNCARKAREASDAFEHGYSDFGDIHKPAREVLVRTAAY